MKNYMLEATLLISLFLCSIIMPRDENIKVHRKIETINPHVEIEELKRLNEAIRLDRECELEDNIDIK